MTDDILSFHVYANGEMNYDMTLWLIEITIGAEIYSSTQFSYVQGYRNWYYMQYFHSNNSYAQLTYNSATDTFNVSLVCEL